MTQHNPNLSLNQRGKDVALLQSRLSSIGYTIDTSEIIGELFGQSTYQAVVSFQRLIELPVTGVVDDATASAIVSRYESEKTMITPGPQPVQGHAASPEPGSASQELDKPVEVSGGSTQPPTQGTPASDGQRQSTTSEQKAPETNAQVPPAADAQGQQEQGIATVGTGDGATAGASTASQAATMYVVAGTVTSPDSAAVGGLVVQVVDKNVGGDSLLAETTTDARGHYQASFSGFALLERHKTQPDLQARVYGTKTFLAASEVRYNASTNETLDVRLPANVAALPSEYETLMAALAVHYNGRLGSLQENVDRQDITYLGNKSGWDARAVAFAALADQFGSTTTGAATGTIRPEFYYALFRAGLPANAETLYQADPKAAGAIWKQAVAQGVIPKALESEIPNAVQAFQALSSSIALNVKPPIGVSTLKELLQLTLGDNAQHQQQFADLYIRYQNDLPTFWSTLERSLGTDITERLQLDGQLGYLTLNNAPLIAHLHDTERESPLRSTLDLAQRSYYQAAKWMPLLAGTTPIPTEIPGSTPDEQRANYADYLATQVRVTFPTAVVADFVKSGTVAIPGGAEVQNGIYTFLSANQGKFEIGMEPIERYLARTNQVESVDTSVVTQIKRLQRVYQITPTDQAFTVLLQHNLDSAYQVTRYDASAFVRTFQDALGGEAVASLVYAKARQVHSTVLNLVGTYLTAQRAPVLGSDPSALILDPAPTGKSPAGAPIVAYPTLEGLFHSMNYCDCDECGSILSPAAYLVDLLQFIDFQKPQKQNAQDVLFSRRPDLQYLPLTCENTNIALPYIDLVNEALEYFVANSLSLTGYTGHNTDGTITSEELMANPQFVSDAAYTTLETSLFPPPLPFHRSLELLRRHLLQFNVPLQAAMAALRPSDALERGSAAYGWRDILMEQLGLSRVEYRILTDRTLGLWQLYSYPQQADSAVISKLSSFQDFSRRVSVSYDDLVAILRTRFINPNGTLIPRLERLNAPFTTLQALKNGTITDDAFKALLPAGLDPAEYGGDIVAWVKDPTNYARIMSLITISSTSTSTDTPDPCSAADLQFAYVNPDPSSHTLPALDFIRLLRFIRLWQKLGLTIEQTDDIITALYPPADLPTGTSDAADLQRLDAGFLTLLPRIGFVFQVMNLLQLTANQDLQGLLTCWAPIGTAGDNSLYRAMFLTPTLLQQDSAFADDGYGNFLRDNTQKLLSHEPPLRAALNLTGAEFALITGDKRTGGLGFDNNTQLTLENISAVYRHGWLARKLGLSVVEFLLLKQFTGLDPFAAPDPGTTPPAEPAVIRFIRLLQALRTANLQPVQALYLICNEDISGTSAPREADITGLARMLRADFAAVESQFALINDPNGDIAKSLLTLVYGADAANFYFGILNNTLAVSTSYSNPQPTLAQPILDAANVRLSYDDLRKQLTYTGVLDASTLAALDTAISANPPSQNPQDVQHLQDAVTTLSTANHKVVDPFFATYPELLPLYTAYAADSADPQTKRTTLLGNLLPDLKRRRKQEQALSVITAAAGTDSRFATALLENADVLQASGSAAGQAAINDLTAIEEPGLSTQFFGPMVVTWSGYLDVPQDGYYNFYITADAGATVTLSIGGANAEMALEPNSATVWRNQNPISLTAGALSPIALTLTPLTSTLTLSWQGQSPGLGMQVIPETYLYSATLIDSLRNTYVRFLKATALATALSLTANEVAYLAADEDLQVNGWGWLNILPVSRSLDPSTAMSLRDVLSGLLTFARLKAALSPNDERLLAVLENPEATLPNGKSALLTLTKWDQDSLAALLTQFTIQKTADLTHLENFRSVYDAYTLATTCRISAAALIAATTNEPAPETVSALQAALRACYARADWLAVVKPINDTMRELQRNALVAYVLQQLGDNPQTSDINTPDKLFEYFLMDVEMEPCMQTSRIRHALSSVQLFIERCLRNLERDVAASDFRDPNTTTNTGTKAAQWEWMKRYRVWQANREIFLYPENWLEPELRDDQSPFFKDTMSKLLQNDITDDAASVAFLDYLTKLEEIAKLEPCGLYYIPSDPNQTNEVAHVIARTAGANRKYYYRRLEGGSWTPWEQIPLDIEDTPVAPIVWNNRLLLFWLRILKQPNAQPVSFDPTKDLTSLAQTALLATPNQTQVSIQAVLCWSEYYNGKWQATKTSDVNRPTVLTTYPPAGDGAFDRSQLHLLAVPHPDSPIDRLLVVVGGVGIADPGWIPLEEIFNLPSGFLLYNTHSLPTRREDINLPIRGTTGPLPVRRIMLTESLPFLFSIQYELWEPDHPPTTEIENPILKTLIDERVIEPQFGLPDVWDAPFFFEDSRNVFYVTTAEAMVTISEYAGFGISLMASNVASETIPPLVVQQQPALPDKPGPITTSTNHGIGHPTTMQQFVNNDTTIHIAIGTTAAVQYGGSEIDPTGGLVNRQGSQA